VLKTLEGKHIKADITLPYGRILHDYIDQVGGLEKAKEIARTFSCGSPLASDKTQPKDLPTPSLDIS